MAFSIVRLGCVCALTVLAACGSDPAVGGDGGVDPFDGGPSDDLNAPKGACAIQWDNGAGYSSDFCEDDIWDWHCDSWAESLGA
jgi:hypothetical protein